MIKATGVAALLLMMSSTAMASITQVSTHTLTAPSSAYEDDSFTVSWNVKSGYNHYNYTGYLLRVYPPSDSGIPAYSEHPNGTSFSFNESQLGEWCFRVRARTADGLSKFSNRDCTTINAEPAPPPPPTITNQRTHRMNNVVGSLAYGAANKITPITVSWSAEPAFSSWNFTENFMLRVTPPVGAAYSVQVPGTSYSFVPGEAGNWSFKVRARYNGLGAYSTSKSINVEDVVLPKQAHNLLGEGTFEDRTPDYWQVKSKYPNGFDSTFEFYPFARHKNHIGGNSRTAQNTILFTSYRKNGNGHENWPIFIEGQQINSEAQFKEYCADTGFAEWQCRKSEISYSPLNLNGYAGGDIDTGAHDGGTTTTWLAYRFKINEWYTMEECRTLEADGKTVKEDRNCKIFLSQYHYENETFYAPMAAIDVRRIYGKADANGRPQKILALSHKNEFNYDHLPCNVPPKHSHKSNLFSCLLSTKITEISQAEDNGKTIVRILNDKYYNIVLKTTWIEPDSEGEISAWVSEDDGATYHLIGSEKIRTHVRKELLQKANYSLSAIPTGSAPRLKFGMYMGEAFGNIVNTREKRREPPISVEFEDIFQATERKHLPPQYRNVE